MAKFELKFIDVAQPEAYIKVGVIDSETESINEIKVISITGLSDEGDNFRIWLDKSTAIKFAKTLRTEINKITESEGANG
jgi:hypothetical protein